MEAPKGFPIALLAVLAASSHNHLAPKLMALLFSHLEFQAVIAPLAI